MTMIIPIPKSNFKNPPHLLAPFRAINGASCRFCTNLQMALPGDSNVEDFDQELFNKNRPQVELFCDHPLTPEIFWNERSGGNPEIMLDKFSCGYFELLKL